jgi:hypothetical protein
MGVIFGTVMGDILGTVLGFVFLFLLFGTRSAGECCGPEGLCYRSAFVESVWLRPGWPLLSDRLCTTHGEGSGSSAA